MARRILLPAAGGLLALLAGSYLVLSTLARRPLAPAEYAVFGAAVLRATPAFLGSSDPVETLRLGGSAFGSPLEAATLTLSGEAVRVPLPPRTSAADAAAGSRFVTFATSRELRTYLHETLPATGWRYREQFGSMHALERDGVSLSISMRFYVGTRVTELLLGVRPLRGTVD